MPVGVLIDAGAVLIGCIAGGLMGKFISEKIRQALTNIFGLSAIMMGITLIVQVKSLSAVILAMILGTLAGELMNLESGLTGLLKRAEQKLPGDAVSKEQMDHLISMVVLFGFSGTGIFGALVSGINGDHSILIAKSVLDFFTAVIFGSIIGYLLMVVVIPQFCIGTILFLAATILMPLINETMLCDFKACGGLVTLAVGLKISGIKTYRVLNLLPAFILILPLSYLWMQIM